MDHDLVGKVAKALFGASLLAALSCSSASENNAEPEIDLNQKQHAFSPQVGDGVLQSGEECDDGNNADNDDDGDGQLDTDEQFCGSDPLDAQSSSPDNELDGIPDCIDEDDDNDGALDIDDHGALRAQGNTHVTPATLH